MTRALLFLLLVVACDDGARTLARLDLAFESPVDGALVFAAEPFPARVRATTNEALTSVELRVGEVSASTCAASQEDPTEILCELEIDPRRWAGQQQDGRLKLSATVTTAEGETKQTSITVNVTPVFVAFVTPEHEGTVAGSSTLEVQVRGEVGIERVEIAYDDGVPLHVFRGEPWSTSINWPAETGVGTHALSATVFDVQARSATAHIEVLVACEVDTDCEVAQVCCASGLCAAAC